MELAVLVLHLVVSVCLIGLVLLQRSEGGALGMGGGGGGSLMSGRGAADALARMTSIAGGFFLVTSLSLTVISGASASRGPSPLDIIPSQQQPVQAPETAAPVQPDPTESSAPQATETELAALNTAPAPSVIGAPVAPPAAQATERAAPLTSTPQPASARTPVVQRPATPPAQQAATPAVQRAATPPAQRAATPPAQRPATQTVAATQRPTQRPATQAPAPAQRSPGLVLPNTSGASLAEPAPTAPESVDVGGGLEAVRRERAGPDQ